MLDDGKERERALEWRDRIGVLAHGQEHAPLAEQWPRSQRIGRAQLVVQDDDGTAKALQRLDRVDLGELLARRRMFEPRQEARQGGAVAHMRCARAFDLDRVLHRLHERNGI